jgi:hypothetical protein
MVRKRPWPDTFIGRKTQEPFPKEKDEPATEHYGTRDSRNGAAGNSHEPVRHPAE